MKINSENQFKRISEFAPAKINYSLAVGPVGSDGFHPIDSLVAFADLGDELEFSASSELKLTISGPFAHEVASDDNNLVIQAAQALAQALKLPKLGAHIYLTKNLPVSSGIGGGSSDAAASLRGLNRLWGAGKSLDQLARIGAGFGSDIPVCVVGGAKELRRPDHWLRIGGRGERLQWVKAGPCFHGVLVNPRIALSTAKVFAQFDKDDCLPDITNLSLDELKKPVSSWFISRNDLTDAAISLCPEIGQVLQELRELSAKGRAQMSGSGATCFAEFPSAMAAKQAAKILALRHRSWWIKPVAIGNLSRIDSCD